MLTIDKTERTDAERMVAAYVGTTRMHLVDSTSYLERAILAAPTGKHRNALCDANIHIQAAIAALELSEMCKT